MQEAGWSEGDKAQIRAGKQRYKVVIVGPCDFPGYVFVKWPVTRHISRVKLDWLERPPERRKR